MDRDDRDRRGGDDRESRRPEDVNKMHSLKIDNLSFNTTKESLTDLYGKFGEIGDIYIPRDRYSDKPRGFAFVRFVDKDSADRALEETDGKDVDGRSIRVEIAKPLIRDYNGGGRGGGRGGGGRGGGRGRGGGGGDYRRERRDYDRRSRSPRGDRGGGRGGRDRGGDRGDDRRGGGGRSDGRDRRDYR